MERSITSKSNIQGRVLYLWSTDITECNIQVIVQQCNCVSKTVAGLSATIAKKFPHGNFYSTRVKPSVPGTIEIRGGPQKNQRWICAFYAQYYPGKPTKRAAPGNVMDVETSRIKWFKMCLDKLVASKNLQSIAFPYKIGCGLAAGEWVIYEKMIREFAAKIPQTKVYIVCPNGPTNSDGPSPSGGESSKVDVTEISDDMWSVFIGVLNDRDCRPLIREYFDNELDITIDVIKEMYTIKLDKETTTVSIIEGDPEIEPTLSDSLVVSIPPGSTAGPVFSMESSLASSVSLARKGAPGVQNLARSVVTEKPMFKSVTSKIRPNASGTIIVSAYPAETYTWENSNLMEFTRAHCPRGGWDEFFSPMCAPTITSGDGTDSTGESEPGHILALSEYLQDQARRFVVYPPLHLVYEACNRLSVQDVKVVLLGQDPYHGENQAIGLSFAVDPDTPQKSYPPSLKNILKEMANEGISISDTPDFSSLAKKGVLMLNTALTVVKGTPGSHSKEWMKHFTPQFMSFLNDRCQPLVVLMLGAHAESFSKYFDGEKHRKVVTVHPSPLSASRGFFGSHPFTTVNEKLVELGREEIDWTL